MGIVYIPSRKNYVVTLQRNKQLLRGTRAKVEEAEKLFEVFKSQIGDTPKISRKGQKYCKNLSQRGQEIKNKKNNHTLSVPCGTAYEAPHGRCREAGKCLSYLNCLWEIGDLNWGGWRILQGKETKSEKRRVNKPRKVANAVTRNSIGAGVGVSVFVPDDGANETGICTVSAERGSGFSAWDSQSTEASGDAVANNSFSY